METVSPKGKEGVRQRGKKNSSTPSSALSLSLSLSLSVSLSLSSLFPLSLPHVNLHRAIIRSRIVRNNR
jgi:hypothetical protein